MWHRVKRCYCSGQTGRWAMSLIFVPWFFLRTVGKCLVTGHNEFREYRRNRGMSITHDWHDWLGGLPFEVATVESIVSFFQARGFRTVSLGTTRRLGCNEFLLSRSADPRQTGAG